MEIRREKLEVRKANQLSPQLRFPDFREDADWGIQLVDKLLQSVPTRDYQIPTTEIYKSGEYPVIDQGKNQIAGYSNLSECVFNNHPIIVFGDHTTIVKYIDFDFIVGADGTKLLKKRNQLDSLKYVFFAVAHKKMNQEGYKRHFSILRKIPIPIPEPPEQQKIADFLGSLDELIAAHRAKLSALQDHKKGLLQQLFPAEGQTTPTLRFPEFQNAGEWDVRTVGDMFRLINGCAFKPEDWKPRGTPIIRIQNLNDPSAEFNYSAAPVLEQHRIESGNLLFAWSGTLGSSFGARIWNGPSGVLNQHIFKVLMDEQQITLPFSQLVLARIEQEIARRTHGFKASFVHVKKSDLVKVKLPLPPLPEQEKIGGCLSDLDALITAQTEQIAALQEHKKGLMQQLFPNPDLS